MTIFVWRNASLVISLRFFFRLRPGCFKSAISKNFTHHNVSSFAGYLRLGCIARDRGQIWDASIWFKDALDVDPVSGCSSGVLHIYTMILWR